MPKILVVHPFAQAISGPDRSILTVIKELVPKGFHFDVVLPGESPFGPQYEALGCRLFYYPMSIIKRRFDISYLFDYTWRFLPTIQFIRKVIREVQPDLVHTNGAVILGSGIAAKLENVKSIYHIRCSAIAKPRPVAAMIAHLIGFSSQKVIGISNACAAPMTERGYKDITTVIYNGIDLSPFAEPADVNLWRKQYGIPDNAPVIGQVGRMGPGKGFLEFIRVAAHVHAEVPSAHFIAVGAPHLPKEHEYEEQVRAEVSRQMLGNLVHFAGHRTDIAAVMRGLDVFVTMSKNEGLGRVAVEAMAAECPVVANRVDGLCEVVVDGETGFLAGPDSPEASAERVIQILKDPELGQRLGDAGRTRAHSHFSAAECARRTAIVYNEVLAQEN